MGLGVAGGVGIGILIPALVLLAAWLLSHVPDAAGWSFTLGVGALLVLPLLMLVVGFVLVFVDGVRAYGVALMTAAGVSIITSAGLCFALLAGLGSTTG